MEIVTSWMERGIEQGIEQGIKREKALIMRQLQRQVGELPAGVRRQVEQLSIDQSEALGEALLRFTQLTEVTDWLAANHEHSV
jgi:F0F1-type ATP synthase membrane subunit b/b'